jgi:hypothetical protein
MNMHIQGGGSSVDYLVVGSLPSPVGGGGRQDAYNLIGGSPSTSKNIGGEVGGGFTAF